jgi:hypothetical protein
MRSIKIRNELLSRANSLQPSDYTLTGKNKNDTVRYKIVVEIGCAIFTWGLNQLVAILQRKILIDRQLLWIF